jgi:predicted dehydrogenase
MRSGPRGQSTRGVRRASKPGRRGKPFRPVLLLDSSLAASYTVATRGSTQSNPEEAIMKTLKVGVIGTGFIGPAHVESVRRLGGIKVVGLAEVDQKTAEAKADEMGIPRAYGDFNDLLADDEIVAVHNCTPNSLHYPINKAILKAGKHCISEKPLAMNSKESRELVKLAEQSGRVHAMNFNYRMNPVIQQARLMIQKGDLGDIWAAHGTYIQDWLIKPTDYTWRILPELSGPSRCFADIGSHWCDMIQTLMGAHVTEVVGEFKTVYEKRQRPKREVEAFSGKKLTPKDYQTYKVETEDLAMAMMKLSNGALAQVVTSQISAGWKNGFTFGIDGSKASIWWDQERPNELKIGRRDEPNQMLVKDASLFYDEAAEFAHFPGGHTEGYDVGTKNMCMKAYQDIRRGRPRKNPLYATFVDGHAEMCICDAVIKSAKSRRWTKVKY